MANYLVTGGGGFIGSNLVEHLLARGDSVRVLDDFSTGRHENLADFFSKIDLIEGDLRDAEICARAVADMDYVLHQAAVPSVPRSVADPMRSHDVNVTGLLNLLAAARDAHIKRFVFASSSSVYGDQAVDVKSENLRLNPMSPYAASKAAGEHYVRAFSLCYGMEAVSLRYFNVFGPRQDPNSPYSAVIPLFIKAMLEGRAPTVHGTGEQARDFTYVENNVRANILAATADFEAKGQAYNIACGASYSILDLVKHIGAVLGVEPLPHFAPARVGDVRVSKADIARAQHDFDYQVSVKFEEGLKRTVDWYSTFFSRGKGVSFGNKVAKKSGQ